MISDEKKHKSEISRTTNVNSKSTNSKHLVTRKTNTENKQLYDFDLKYYNKTLKKL